MEYVLSRREYPCWGDGEPPFVFYNMWRKRLRPYAELEEEDIVYLYSSRRGMIEWRSSAEQVECFPYDSKQHCLTELEERFGLPMDDQEEYFQAAPESGYCLAYALREPRPTKPIERPDAVEVPQHGWLAVQDVAAARWVARCDGDDGQMLDDLAEGADLLAMLHKLDQRMADLPPYRVRRVVRQTIRRDTPMIRALKKACGYRCQFPGCGVGIPKRNGELHVVVHHIRPVATGGPSVLGNLVVLCPNHHAEFEYGDVEIREQRPGLVAGVLNGKKFAIALPQ